MRPSVLREAAVLLDADECAALAVHGNQVDAVAGTVDVLPGFADVARLENVVTICKPVLLNDPAAHAMIAHGASSQTLYLPLAADSHMLGVLVAHGPLRECRAGSGPVPPTVAAVGQTLAIALDRGRLGLETARLEALRQSDEFKGVLLAAISHELKTPIAAVKATVTGLLGPGSRWDEDGLRTGLQAIEEANDRLDRLVTNLLDLSRIEADAVHLHPDWCDVNDLVGSAVAACGHALDDRELTFVVPDDLPRVYVDFVLIVQVLSDLLDREIHRAPGRIQVSARHGDAGMVISVSDDGPGIAPDLRTRVFEKFYRGPNPSARRVAGAGLGLAICRGLTEKHGGTIEATAPQAGGATISFTLPNAPEGNLRIGSAEL